MSFPRSRPRRLRIPAFARALVAEHQLSSRDLIWPVFIHAGNEPIAIPSMPGVWRLPLPELLHQASAAHRLGLQAIALFPVEPADSKSADGATAWHDEGLIQRAVRVLKAELPVLGVITDVALDPYTESGQDGLTDANGEILNDPTVAALVRQALSHAAAGADMVAPSDMMDGRIGAIRDALEAAGHSNTLILSYAAKYASCFYGPFRDAVGSAANLGKASKASYQLDPANGDEAMREIALDLEEGADIVMVKPGLPYLDIVRRVKAQFAVPTFAYQVSGEYAQLKAAALAGWLDERRAVLEALLCFKRAGADAVLSYYSPDVLKWLAEG